jgi:magnesium-protoporphyrin O-methyltransferase
MLNTDYLHRRDQLEHYFGSTAARAWDQLTSNAPVSRIRATVRAGRDRMRSLILDLLPRDLRGRRVLDAGCGTGALAQELAGRGARVIAVDIASAMVELARQRSLRLDLPGSIEFLSGDMTDAALGEFDHVVAMDSLIHYEGRDTLRVIAGLARRTRRSMVFTFAPRTPALAVMHTLGRAFPRSNRAPSITPVAEGWLRSALAADPALRDWSVGRDGRIAHGFYTSHALELNHA